jgi:hypothetical protein
VAIMQMTMKANLTNESFKKVRHHLILFASLPNAILITKIWLLQSSDKTIFYHHFFQKENAAVMKFRLKKNNPRS